MKKYRVKLPEVFYRSFLVEAEDPDAAILLAKKGLGEDEGTLVPLKQVGWKAADEVRSKVSFFAACGAIDLDREFTEEEQALWGKDPKCYSSNNGDIKNKEKN